MMTGDWLQSRIAETQVVVIAGGRAKRMGGDIPKCLLDIGNRKLLDLCIESLSKEGFKNFVFLLGHKHEMVEQYVANGDRYGIEAKYSIDPPSSLGWGKGKAFKYALKTGKIDSSKRSLVVFPDDIILEENIFSKFLMNHLDSIHGHDVFASTLLVNGTEYPYAVAELDEKNLVQQFTEKPFLDKPTSVGVYIFESAVYDILNSVVRLEDPTPVDLESTIMPKLVTGKKLAGFIIANSKWIPVNTMKEYEQAIKVLSSGKR